MKRRECIERYSGLRGWFDQLLAFAEAARQELPPDSPLLPQDDIDNWMGQMRAYQRVCCERCGAFLSADALGLGAYAIESFARVCGMCFDELTSEQPSCLHRLARLTVYAQEQPQLFAGLLVEAQRRLHLDDWELEGYLGLDAAGVLRLALAPRPRVDHEDGDIALIARVVECEAAVLRLLLSATSRNSCKAAYVKDTALDHMNTERGELWSKHRE